MLCLSSGLAVAATCFALGTGVGTEGTDDTQEVSDHLGAARQFAGYPLYFAGPRVSDKALTRSGDGQAITDFYYGDCEASSDSGCTQALQIENWASCERALNAPLFGPPGTRRLRVRLRGVPAAVFRYGQEIDRVELYTARTTVVLYAHTGRILQDAVAGLRPVNGPARADGTLRPGRAKERADEC